MEQLKNISASDIRRNESTIFQRGFIIFRRKENIQFSSLRFFPFPEIAHDAQTLLQSR